MRGPVWDRLVVTDRYLQLDYSQAGPETKINSFPGTKAICRKDLLYRNYKKCQLKYGEKCFNFCPESFSLPEEWNLLQENNFENRSVWIVKPSFGFAGKGIHVIKDIEQLSEIKSKSTVQKYVTNPYLIRGLKFDIRLYVLLTSIDPLMIFLYDDGLVRFATDAFSMNEEDLGNNFIHVTNPIINKDNKDFVVSDDYNQFKGHKWTLNKFVDVSQATGS